MTTQAKRGAALLAGVGLIAVLVVACMNVTAPRPALTQDKPAPLRANRVHALGRLEPASRVLRIAASSGNEGTVVAKLKVKEGDEVEAGQIVAILDNYARREAALFEAKAKVAYAEAKLAQTRAGAKAGDIEAKRAAVNVLAAQSKFAQRQVERAKQLKVNNALTAEELENREWAYEKVTLEHAQAEQTLAAIAEVRDIDVQVSEQELLTAKAAVARADADLFDSQVRAPTTGRILAVHAREGERIGEQGFLELGDVLNMQAVAEVFEGDLGRIRVGQKAQVRVQSSEKVLEGEVEELGQLVARKVVLSNDPVSDTDARVVEVRIKLRPEDAEAVARLSNARVEVTISLD